jgi:hypothetical protein
MEVSQIYGTRWPECAGRKDMGIWTILQKTEQSLRKRIETAFSAETASSEYAEIRCEILKKIESEIRSDHSGLFFPYIRVLIELHPPSAAVYRVFFAEFLYEDSLKAEIARLLKGKDARCLEDFEIIVDLESDGEFASPDCASQPLYKIDFINLVQCESRDVPEIRLLVARGTAEQSEYRLKKERILIGRIPDVMDREGRIVRKNDVVFLDNDEDVNATVGYSHARIWWDFEEKKFFLMDESSRYGTCIVRQGRSLEVPEGNHYGIQICKGDEIYCGQACLRFNA